MLWKNNHDVNLTLDHYDVRNLITDFNQIEKYLNIKKEEEVSLTEEENRNNLNIKKKEEFNSNPDEQQQQENNQNQNTIIEEKKDFIIEEKKKKKKKAEVPSDIIEALCELERYLSLPPNELSEGIIVHYYYCNVLYQNIVM
jgi:hypothetical protein